jgi:hypothetical protein
LANHTRQLINQLNYSNEFTNIIPIGDHCVVSILLKELGLRVSSYPFDWVTFKEQINDSNVFYNCEIIEKLKKGEHIGQIVNEFINDAFDINKKTNTNSKTTMWFPHDTKQSKNEPLLKYIRRFHRLRDHISHRNNLYILITRHFFISQELFYNLSRTLLENNGKILYISGVDHPYFKQSKNKNITFKQIPYDVSKFYDYDYTHFRPQVKTFLSYFFNNTTCNNKTQ